MFKNTNILSESVQLLTLEDIFFKEKQYKIPIFQRSYDWGEKEISLLLEDFINAYKAWKDNPNSLYYLGILTVEKVFNSAPSDNSSAPSDNNSAPSDNISVHSNTNSEYYVNNSDYYFRIIDGQQRLMTTYILFCALLNLIKKELNKNNNEVLAIYNNEISLLGTENFSYEVRDEYNNFIKSVLNEKNIIDDIFIKKYLYLKNILINELKSCCDKEIFYSFIKRNIKIVQYCLPKNTKIPFYYQIQNTRTKQLEQHEFIKFKIISLKSGIYDRTLWHQINRLWTACSEMDGILSDSSGVNGNRNDYINGKIINIGSIDANLIININNNSFNFHENVKCLTNYNENEENILVTSIISFPNFLNHIIYLYFNINYRELDSVFVTKFTKNFTKNDNKLYNNFELLVDIYEFDLKHYENEYNFFQFNFVLFLFKCRLILDRFVIKRYITKNNIISDDDKDIKLFNFKKFKNEKNPPSKYNLTPRDNSIILQNIEFILRFFYASDQFVHYQKWLLYILKWIISVFNKNSNSNISLLEYYCFLQKLARYLFLSQLKVFEKQKDSNEQEDLIDVDFVSNLKPKLDDLQFDRIKDNIDLYRTHYTFNYLDYLLYYYIKCNPNSHHKFIINLDNFYFTKSRDSYEHFAPQNEKEETKLISNDYIDTFGNVCLLNSSFNTSLLNLSPDNKVNIITENSSNSNFSLKLLIMCSMLNDNTKWTDETLKQHAEEMFDVIKYDYFGKLINFKNKKKEVYNSDNINEQLPNIINNLS
ncbi:MAG: DUF262 domain-containing HNH endonuclease family protein [Deltaproteobacteria bacterium]|jgi:hypothetical protein|nr:DUF262 domain-containing HNH endonuclease family protein [Deltaproteobacteria bacterium]